MTNTCSDETQRCENVTETGESLCVGKPAPRDFLFELKLLEPMSMDTFLVLHGEREYVLKRHGECDSASCRAACCTKICLTGEYSEYLEGFAEKGVVAPLVHKRCAFLGDNALCTRWRESNYPLPCRMFPMPSDRLYFEVMDVCSYHFVIEADVTNMRERGAGFYEGGDED